VMVAHRFSAMSAAGVAAKSPMHVNSLRLCFAPSYGLVAMSILISHVASVVSNYK
jgi:hypothetical protein